MCKVFGKHGSFYRKKAFFYEPFSKGLCYFELEMYVHVYIFFFFSKDKTYNTSRKYDESRWYATKLIRY